MRIALECGTHSPWISRLLKKLGHQVIVANARKIPAITGSESKNDRNDAELLARFAAHDPKLLSPVQHRSLQRQQDLNLIQVRSTLVRARIWGLITRTCHTKYRLERAPQGLPILRGFLY